MAHQLDNHANLLGFNVQGDVGPITYYRSSRGRIVAFTKSPPLSPPTRTQIHFRNLFRLAARAWRSLPPTTREKWQRVATKARLRLTGYDLWVWFQRSQDRGQLATFFRLAGEEL